MELPLSVPNSQLLASVICTNAVSATMRIRRCEVIRAIFEQSELN